MRNCAGGGLPIPIPNSARKNTRFRAEITDRAGLFAARSLQIDSRPQPLLFESQTEVTMFLTFRTSRFHFPSFFGSCSFFVAAIPF